MRLVRLLEATLAVAIPLAASGQDTLIVRGSVLDSAGRPVPGVAVLLDWVPRVAAILDSTRRGATTDDHGYFEIRRVAAGPHAVLLRGIPLAHPITSDSFHVVAGQRSILQFIVEPIRPPREVVLRCRADAPGVPAGATSYSGRRVQAPCCVPVGSGIVRDESSWDALWDVYGNGKRSPRRQVHWDREMVFLSSLNSTLGEDYLIGFEWADTHQFNRAIELGDSLVIELGPDSLFMSNGLTIDVIPHPVATVLPRVDRPVVIRFVSGRPNYDRGPDRWPAAWDSLAHGAARRASKAFGTYVLLLPADSLRPLNRSFERPHRVVAQLLAADLTLAPRGRLTARLTAIPLDSGAVPKRASVTGFWSIIGDTVVFYDKPCRGRSRGSCDPPLPLGGPASISGDTVTLRGIGGFVSQAPGPKPVLRFVRRRESEP